MSGDDIASLSKRLDALERVLGLQQLGGADDESLQLAGLSTQSNHCGGSALSVVCVAEAVRAIQ